MVLMKNIAAFCFLMFLLNPVYAHKAKLSPQTRQYLLHSKNVGGDNVLPSYIYKTGPDNTLYIGALIKAGSVQEPQLQGLGIKIGTKAGDIWTLQVPVAAVEAFTNVAGIEYIELDQPVFPNLDTARVLTRVDSVHAGINLPMPYTGKDVVVGIIDAGFDYSQVACFDTSGTIFRLKKVWEQKKPGIPPSQYFYGNELSTSTSMFSAKLMPSVFRTGRMLLVLQEGRALAAIIRKHASGVWLTKVTSCSWVLLPRRMNG